MPASQGADKRQAPALADGGPAEDELAVSAHRRPDRLASGSPARGRSLAADAAPKRLAPSSAAAADGRGRVPRQASPAEPDEVPIPYYKLPPPRPDLPSRHDQENEAPPTFKRNKPAGDVVLDTNSAARRPLRPSNVGPAAVASRAASPERKPMAPLDQNTPRRVAPRAPPKMSILDAATSAAGAATTAQAARKRNHTMRVNGKSYTRLDSLGRGGSAKVYRVAAENGRMLALKRVSLVDADANTVRGYKGEIDLLSQLRGVERVISLLDHEMNEEKQMLSLVSPSTHYPLRALSAIPDEAPSLTDVHDHTRRSWRWASWISTRSFGGSCRPRRRG